MRELGAQESQLEGEAVQKGEEVQRLLGGTLKGPKQYAVVNAWIKQFQNLATGTNFWSFQV